MRSGLAISAAAALVLTTAGIAVADTIATDGDTVKSPPHVQYDDVENPANHVCSTRGTPVDGEITLAFGGGSHFTAGEPLDVQITDGQPGITVTQPASVSIPSTWTSGSTLNIPIQTTVTTAVPQGTHTVSIEVSGASLTKTDSYDVVVTTDCAVTSANTAPSVQFTSPPASTDEGSATPFTFSVSDADAGDSWSFAAGYPDCGSGTVSAATTTPSTSTTGTFSCTFPDGVPGADPETVSVRLVDGAGATSNLATTDITVNNVTPAVTAGTLGTTNVDCKTTVTLTGSSFIDPGADADWDVTIDWGDGSDDTTFPQSTAGGIDDQTHEYVTPGGPYTVTVKVKDKDGAEGSDTSVDQITVNQTYSVDFLPPFDDSSPSGLIVNKMKNGRVVPVKATIFDDCAGAPVSDPTESVTIKTSKTAGGGSGDPIETYADAGQSASNTNQFRWSSDGFWIYNLDSKGLGLVVNNNYRVDIYVGAVKATVDTWAVLQPVK